MQFEWDENKRLENIRRHGIDFVGCGAIFDGYTFTFEDQRFRYGEERMITLGLFDRLTIVVVHTESAQIVRIISIRKPTRHEQELYFQNAPYPQEPD